MFREHEKGKEPIQPGPLQDSDDLIEPPSAESQGIMRDQSV